MRKIFQAQSNFWNGWETFCAKIFMVGIGELRIYDYMQPMSSAAACMHVTYMHANYCQHKEAHEVWQREALQRSNSALSGMLN